MIQRDLELTLTLDFPRAPCLSKLDKNVDAFGYNNLIVNYDRGLQRGPELPSYLIS